MDGGNREVRLVRSPSDNAVADLDTRLMHTLFKVAKIRAPSIIFIDEIDYLTRMRQQGEDSYDRRVKNQLLELFNVLGKDTSILLIGATNRPWDLDSAFLSRFPQRLFFDLPLEDESVAIISESINGERHDLTSADLYALARSSKGYSGRDINAAIAKMRLQLFREVVHSEHFAPVSPRPSDPHTSLGSNVVDSDRRSED